MCSYCEMHVGKDTNQIWRICRYLILSGRSQTDSETYALYLKKHIYLNTTESKIHSAETWDFELHLLLIAYIAYIGCLTAFK